MTLSTLNHRLNECDRIFSFQQHRYLSSCYLLGSCTDLHNTKTPVSKWIERTEKWERESYQYDEFSKSFNTAFKWWMFLLVVSWWTNEISWRDQLLMFKQVIFV